MGMALVCQVPVIALDEIDTLLNIDSKMMLNKSDRCDININLCALAERLGQLYPLEWPKKPAMLGCSTSCPNCKHEFTCCPPASVCCNQRRSLHVLSGGGLINFPTTAATAVPEAVTPTVTLAPFCADGSSPCPSPQISPSTRLAFIIPPFPAVTLAPAPKHMQRQHLQTHQHHQQQQQQQPQQVLPLLPLIPASFPPAVRPENELQRLGDIERALRQSGWYYEGISYKNSDELLRHTEVGTFLVRNSADPRYLFSLSMQTERGPSSVRLCYANGYFRLEARAYLQADMPLFPGVVELIEYYVGQFKYSSQVWEDPHGKFYSAMVLTKPLRKHPPDLKHLARLAIHRKLQAARPRVHNVGPKPHTQLGLPASVEDYLSDYPYSL